MKNSNRYTFPCPISVSFENEKGEIIQVGKEGQQIRQMNKHKGIIYGSSKPQNLIYFSFNKGSNYPIGWWRNRFARDIAYRKLTLVHPATADSRITTHMRFSYGEWFKPIELSSAKAKSMLTGLNFAKTMNFLVDHFGTKGDIVRMLNETYATPDDQPDPYTMDHVNVFLKGKIPRGMARHALTTSLALKFNAPKELLNQGLYNELFWGALINQAPVTTVKKQTS